jgi:hypothetical protein
MRDEAGSPLGESAPRPLPDVCVQLERAQPFSSHGDLPEFATRAFLYTDNGREFLADLHRSRQPRYPADHVENNPPWVQYYAPVWTHIPRVHPQRWADYSRDRYVLPIIGVVSHEGEHLLAIGNDSANTLLQGYHDCLHNYAAWLPTAEGADLYWRNKVYLLENDAAALVERVENDFPRVRQLQETRVPAEADEQL